MTDNVFEIETAAIALSACHLEDPGVFLTDFSCAYSSVDHRWIFMVLERAAVLLALQVFLSGIFSERLSVYHGFRSSVQVVDDQHITTRASQAVVSSENSMRLRR